MGEADNQKLVVPHLHPINDSMPAWYALTYSLSVLFTRVPDIFFPSFHPSSPSNLLTKFSKSGHSTFQVQRARREAKKRERDEARKVVGVGSGDLDETSTSKSQQTQSSPHATSIGEDLKPWLEFPGAKIYYEIAPKIRRIPA